MSLRPEPEEEPFTQKQLEELRNNLSRLSGPSVMDFYRDAHKDCALEQKPRAKSIQRLVAAWRILSRWNWK
jgi:hypothetical protein